MSIIDFGLYLTYFLLLVTALLAIGFSLANMLQNMQAAKKALIGVALMAVVFIISYSLSPSEFYFKGIEQFNISASGIKMVGAGLNTLYMLVGIAVVATIYFEVLKLFK